MYSKEAMGQYNLAMRAGQKYYNACVAKGISPYPEVLDDIFSEAKCAGRTYLGVIDVPLDKIVGSTSAGRKTAFAGNFMPLLDWQTEFGNKWIDLCTAHLDTVGITDPIVCSEYMGKFYVTEGNKRVSVLKSYGAATVPGVVTRLIPVFEEDNEAVQVYYEFMNFYQLSRIYDVSFRRPGGFTRLPAALGHAPGRKWTEDERRDFLMIYRTLRDAYEKMNDEALPLEAGDVLLAWLEMYPLEDLETISSAELNKRLTALWPDLRALANGSHFAVNTDPAEAAEKRGLLRSLGFGKINHLNIAFIHALDPVQSAWTAAHELGRQHLEEVMGDRVSVRTCVCGAAEAADVMEQMVAEGAQVIFTTTPPLIDACRKVAAEHPHVRILNCSLTMPYPSVRTYYSRMYEGKFIAGAIAGAMAEEDCIGYIANYPIAGTLAAINAFALGVRMTNPRARISLRWSCLPGDHVGDLMAEGVSVISNRDNAAGESLFAWEWGTYYVGKDGQLSPLASPCWNWGEMYVKIVDSIFNGSWDTVSGKEEGQAVNYWWGMDSGVVSVELSESLPTGVRQMADILKKGMEAGMIDPFRCEIRDRTGEIRNDGTSTFTPEEIMLMDWLCDNVDGHIPTYEELLPASRPLVRQLGLNRDQLPPETEADP